MRRLLQFSLRTLLLMMLVCGCAMGWIVHKRKQSKERREAVMALREFGGWFSYRRLDPGRPQWLRSLFDEDEMGGVARISLDRTKVTDKDLAHFRTLSSIYVLSLNESKVTNGGLIHLRGLRDLESLHLANTAIDDDGLERLVGFAKLTHLELQATRITDHGLKHLVRLSQLNYLDVSQTQVTDAGLLHLTHLKNLKYLDVTQTAVTADGLDRMMAALPGLVEAYLDDGIHTGRDSATSIP